MLLPQCHDDDRTDQTAARTLPPVLELIGAGPFDPSQVTSEVAPWQEAPEALLGYTTKLVVQQGPPEGRVVLSPIVRQALLGARGCRRSCSGHLERLPEARRGPFVERVLASRMSR